MPALLLGVPLYTPIASALDNAELAEILGVPEEELYIKNLSSASRVPGKQWAIMGSAEGAIYPFSITAYEHGFRLTDELEQQLDALLASKKRSEVFKYLKRIELEGSGFSGMIGVGPDDLNPIRAGIAAAKYKHDS